MPTTRFPLTAYRSPLTLLALSIILACSEDQAPPDPSAAAPDLARAGTAAYTFVDLGTLEGACCSHASAVNDHDQVVGWSEVPFADNGGPGEDRGDHAFLWQNGVMTDLGLDFSQAWGINNAGTVVVNSGRFDEGVALLWKDGQFTQLEGLGQTFDFGFAIAPNGRVVGESESQPNFEGVRAVVWSKSGAVTDLGTVDDQTRSEARAINASGQIVGDANHAVLWSRGQTTDLGTLGGDISYATGINAKGTIVGCSTLAPGTFFTHGFVWQDGAMHDLGTLGGQQSCANGINNAGRIAGSADLASGITHAVVWDQGVVTDLGLLAGQGSSRAYAINAKGTVVGTFEPDPPQLAEHAAMWIRK
jgi:probable HAF family extracellular repeat protein